LLWLALSRYLRGSSRLRVGPLTATDCDRV
jgi:hypothetical protein